MTEFSMEQRRKKKFKRKTKLEGTLGLIDRHHGKYIKETKREKEKSTANIKNKIKRI